MRLIKFIGVFALFTLMNTKLSLCFAQGSLAASPARLFYTGAAGQAVVQTVRLSNTGTSPMTLKASLRDWERDSLGVKLYYAAGTLARSNAGWLRLSTDVVELAPGQEKTVTVTMYIPADVSPQQLKNSMLFFTQINEQNKQAAGNKNQKQVAISVRFEVGIHIYFTPPGLSKKELNFVAFDDRGKVTTTEGRVKRLALTIKNTGEVATEAQLHLEITDAATGEEFKFPERPIAMLPGADQVIYINVPAKLAGRSLVAVAMLDSGAAIDLKVAEKAFKYEL